jgi:hypothetical protein
VTQFLVIAFLPHCNNSALKNNKIKLKFIAKIPIMLILFEYKPVLLTKKEACMKHYKKMFSGLIIAALCFSGMMLGACNRAPEQRTIDAAVNVMMMTNPMGSLYGKTSLSDADSPSSPIAPASVSGTGCPAIDISLSVNFTPTPNFSGSIDLAYNNNCIVHGLALSGEVLSSWSLAGDLLAGLAIESTITFNSFTM